MDSVSDRLLGMELEDAKALLRLEEVAFVVKYTKADIKKGIYDKGEGKCRIIRVKKANGQLELTVNII